MITRRQLLDRIEALRVHQKHGHRAPHKPLLLLYALGELRRGALEIPFERIEQRVGSLLREFGTSLEARQPTPALPFWHLRNDGLWTVQADAELPMGANGKRPNLSDLRRL
ncbi:MAG: hypothetical protein RL398_1064, partial [Planctomycetota bacterium]